MQPIIGAAGFEGHTIIEDWTPPTIDGEGAAVLPAALAAHEDWLRPGDPMAVAGRIHALLAHWRDRDLDAPTRQALAEDWVRVLSRYPLWAVHQAAEEWIELEERRPTVASIRRLCDQAVRQDQLRLALLRRLSGQRDEDRSR